MKRFVLLCTLAFIGVARSHPFEDLIDEEWETYKVRFNKQYETKEIEYIRKMLFLKEREEVTQHNKKHFEGKVSYTKSVNQFSDMTPIEIRKIAQGLDFKMGESKKPTATFKHHNYDVTLPSEVDWRTKGAVTPVKDQGQCGSCWAFSAIGALEGQHYLKKGKLVSLSEQNLVDCEKNCKGCDGGMMSWAFEFIKSEHGIDTEESYPYIAAEQNCHFSEENVGATDNGYVNVTATTDDLMAAIATVGPVSVAICATDDFMQYQKGVFDDPVCQNCQLDHGVLAVGYGTENGKDYWLVKNSWATQWGEEGYVKIVRGKHDCGITLFATYPLI